MNIQENSIIGALVAEDYRTASVFKKHSIDFCCQGNRSVHEACQEKNIATQTVLNDLTSVIQNQSGPMTDFQTWPLDLLADYIEKKHHRYVEQKTLEITPYLDKICRVHGGRHPELLDIKDLFSAAADNLAQHMVKEEQILFPFVRAMVKSQSEKNTLELPFFGTVKNPIEMMMNEHADEGERFRKIEELSNRYTPPEDACNTYRVTFALLQEFEQDLHLHIHLENNILFPKAVELEKQLAN